MATSKMYPALESDIQLFNSYIESIDNATEFRDNGEPTSISRAKSHHTYIKPIWEKCCEVHSRLYHGASPETRATHPHFVERSFQAQELHFLEVVERLQEVIDSPVNSPMRGNETTLSSHEHPVHIAQPPRIELPKFSGSYEEWPSFHDYFKSLFLDAEAYDALQRLHYLKSCLSGEAQALIARLPITAENFSVAWSSLKNRYANPRLLGSLYIKGLFAIKSGAHESVADLRSLMDNFEQHVQTLTNLGRPAPTKQRWDLVKQQNLCRNCLCSGHFVSQCKSVNKCRQCGQPHNTLLHEGAGVSNQPLRSVEHRSKVTESIQNPIPGPSSASSHFSSTVHSSHVVLATAWVLVSGNNSRQARVRVLLDQGSTHTLVSDRLVTALGSVTYPVNATLSGIGDAKISHVKKISPLSISSLRDSESSFNTNALVVRSLTSYTPQFRHSVSWWSHLKNLDIADDDPGSCAPIQLIIGADIYPYVLKSGMRKGSIGQPVAQETVFGWVLSNGTGILDSSDSYRVHAHLTKQADSVESLVRKFWEVEDVFCISSSSDESSLCETYFRDTVARDVQGRYIVRNPFVTFPPPIGNSIQKADKLLCALEGRLSRKPGERQLYIDFIRDYEMQGHMTPLPADSEIPSHIYLPHHPVFKHTSTTTKLRVVFNASSPMDNGRSLNDLQHIGPKLHADLSLLITRWRLYQYVYCADIEKMYRQISVHSDDQRYQCIRWRYKPSEPIIGYQLNTVTYGTASAPYLAQRVLQQLATDEGDRYPLANPVLRNCFYVDDCLFGSHQVDAGRQTRDQLNSLLKCGGFILRKWASNYAPLLEDIPAENHGLAIDKVLQDDISLKILGIVWNPLSDSYRPSVSCAVMNKITKRTVLSAVARLYDPLGWFSPVVITAKIFIQTLWRTGCSWDLDLPDNLSSQWTTFYSELNHLSKLSIPRWTRFNEELAICELHGFADASIKACATVAYLRIVTRSGDTHVSLLGSKTRVAPLKELTIPRLELCAALLLAQLVSSLLTIPEFSDLAVHCWSDSSIVMAWLSKPATTWNMFVANRINMIHELLPRAQWHHVPGIDNPADVASRGISAVALKTCTMWFRGPQWIAQSSEHWPVLECQTPDEDHLEIRAHALMTNAEVISLSVFDRFCCWSRLLRVCNLIRRWIPSNRSDITFSEPPSAEEINTTKRLIIQRLQASQFHSEIECLRHSMPLHKDSWLLSLNPFLDSEGILHVGGRLSQSNLSFAQKHPIILRKHHITTLIVRWAHARCLHGGQTLTLSTLREEFWLLQAKRIIKSIIFHCISCSRIKAELGRQLMGSLPAARTQCPTRAFLHCGIDYAAPLALRMRGGRGSKSHPAYIAIFVCLGTKALHIEIVSDYSTVNFIAAFRRFCSRRGLPSDMYSDHGTNFKGADSALDQAFRKAISHSTFKTLLASDSIIWHYIPPASPHFGGLWEAGVKSVKAHLKKVLLGKTPTFEELGTLTAQIEACLNSRPLSPLTDNPEDLNALTPAHFLIGGPLTAVPQPTLLDTSKTPLSRWADIQCSVELFWHRWSSDYLLALQHRSRWKQKSSSLDIGQLVLISAENLSPSTKWKLGRIVAVTRGSDGFVRVATVRTATSTYVRCINKLAPLPIIHGASPESSS